MRSGGGSTLERGPGPCWRLGSKQVRQARWQAGGRSARPAAWDNPPLSRCRIRGMGWAAAWGGDLGRGLKAKTESQAAIV